MNEVEVVYQFFEYSKFGLAEMIDVFPSCAAAQYSFLL